jgi:hypothetical protein
LWSTEFLFAGDDHCANGTAAHIQTHPVRQQIGNGGNRPMLDGLDQVEWSRLKHAYGAAEDVPDLIRALTSRSADERRAAWHELYGTLWHQGTIYEATLHAVPFFIELAASDETPDRGEILSYLGALADGSSYLDVHQDALARIRGRALSEEELARLEAELGWVAQTRSAVKSAEALYFDSLRSGEHQICCAAAYILSRFPEEGERYWTPLRRRYEEAGSDELVKCGIAMLTKEFSAKGTSDVRWLREAFAREKSRSVCLALAVSIALADEYQDDELAVLIANLIPDDEIQEAYGVQPWNAGQPDWDTIAVLCASKRGRHALVARFNELFLLGGSKDQLDYVRYVLRGRIEDGMIGGLSAQPMGLLTMPGDG